MTDGHIHYRTTLRLYPRGRDPLLLDALKHLLLQWVKSLIDLPPMMEQLGFFAGASWGSSDKVLIHTLRHLAPESGQELWGLRLLRPCPRTPGRSWRTDLVAQTLPGSLKVSLKESYLRTRGYLGPPLPDPPPKVPDLAKLLLADGRWEPRDGGRCLTPSATPLPLGAGDTLRDLLLQPERTCPVLVSAPDHSGQYLLESSGLEAALTGSIHLLTVAPGGYSRLKEELNWLLPREMHPVWGGIRIYQPGITPPGARGWKQESLRHRFFLKKDLQGSGDSLQVFAQCVAARPDHPGEVADIEQAAALIQKAQLEALTTRLKQRAEGNEELRAWMALVEAENTSLGDANTQLRGRIADLEAQVLELEAEIGRIQYQAQQASHSAEGLRAEVLRSSTKIQLLNNLHHLPRTLPEVLQTQARFFARQVVITPQALAAAEQADFDNVPAAWEGLWALFTHLPKLLFEEKLGLRPALERFGELTGLEASASEGEMTRADRKLMAMRRVEWEGQTYSIEPHLKIDRGKRFLRVHFAADFEKGLLILGHVGNHLDTVGTRRGRGR